MIKAPSPTRHLQSRWMGPSIAVALVLGFCLLLLHRDPQFFWNDDNQTWYLPGFRDMARSWEAGEPPLLSPSSWFAGAMAGEYPYGIFSIFIQLVVVLMWKLNLTLPATAALFSMVHLGILAAGAFCLARQRKLAVELAALVAVVASLNGWIICWAATTWITRLTSFAWVPWAWWALVRALESERGGTRWIPAGFFIYLVIAAGNPFSVLILGIITLLQTGRERRRLRALWPLPAAWAWGVALAAPALLMLVEHFQSGQRSEQVGVVEMVWVVPPTAILGLLVPSYTTEWLAFGGSQLRPAVEMACGVLPAVALAAALLRLRGPLLHAFRWDLIALGVVLTLSVLPSFSPFRWSFRWLPLFHLILALLSAQALSSLREDETQRAADPNASKRRVSSFDIVAATLVFVILEAVATRVYPSADLDLDSQTMLLIVSLALVVLCWIWLRRNGASFAPLIRWLPCFVVVVSLWSTYSQLQTRWVGRWDFPESLRQAEPLDPEILYLSLYNEAEAHRVDPGLSQLIRPGNTAMLSGVHMLNGYSTVRPAGLSEVLGMRSHFGFSSDSKARQILGNEAGRGGLLELMGVDGVVISESWQDQAPELLEAGWETAFSSEKGVVLHRTQRSEAVRCVPTAEIVPRHLIPERIVRRSSAQVPCLLARSDSSPLETSVAEPEPLVEFSACTLEVRKNTRLKVEVEVEPLSSERNSLVLFSRAWYPGYRATLNGQALKVHALNLVLPAVEIPAGARGLLVLEYAPAAVRIGLTVAAMALIAGAGVAAASGLRRPASRRKPRPARG